MKIPAAFLTVVASFFVVVARGSQIPVPVLPEGVGVNIHFVRGHERDLDMIAAAGFRFIRMDFGWAGIERQKGTYDWTAYDELTRSLESRGLHAIYILDYSNPLYEETVTAKNPITGEEHRDTASPQHPESVAGYAQFAAAAVTHFRGRPIIWELWNEPNITFWKPKPDVHQYSAMALAAARGIRQAVPDATVVGPATSGMPLDFLEEFFKSGILADLDAVSVHPYRNYSKPPETAPDDYAKVRALIARYAPPAKKDMPLISGEWGYASHQKGVTPEIQAAYAARQQLVNLLAGVPLSIWYDWKNDGENPAEREENFGTVTYDLQPKPAYIALQTLTHELSGYRIDRRLKTDSDKDYVLLCRNTSGQQKLAAWTLNPSNSVALYVTDSVGPVRVMSSDGHTFEVRPGREKVTLDLAPAPVYVTVSPARFTP